MNVRIENGHLIAGNVAVPAGVVPAIEAFYRERFASEPSTDNEREALRTAITDGYWERTGYRVTWEHIGPLMDAIQAAGFRRDRHPESPTDEDREALARDIRERWFEMDGEPDDEERQMASAIVGGKAWRNRHLGPITDEAVERAAVALYERTVECMPQAARLRMPPWDATLSGAVDFRRDARAALEAAEGAR